MRSQHRYVVLDGLRPPSWDNVERDLAILASSLVPFGRKDGFWIGAGNFAHRDPAEAANKRADEK